MKKQSEKKTMTKSIKLSQNEYEQIQKQAADKGMNFSEYIIDSAIHRQNTITPQIAVKVQEIANTALDLADRLSYDEYATKRKLQTQVDDLRELFVNESPLDNYAKIIQNIEKITEGADSLWVYLK